MCATLRQCLFAGLLLKLAVVSAAAGGPSAPRGETDLKTPAADACVQQHARGIERGRLERDVAYNTACCYASADDADRAFQYLQAAASAGYHDWRHLTRDTDLTSLHADPRWQKLVGDVEAAHRGYLTRVNADLYALFLQDQEDRLASKLDGGEILARDRQRLATVKRMLIDRALSAADDYYHAAMILQHGDEAGDYKLAKELAEKAFRLDSSHTSARWLSAAAQDRYLWKTGKPQWFATQFRQDDKGRWTIEPYDPRAITDVQRMELGVPTIAETMDLLEQMNTLGLEGVLDGKSSPP